jgi:hypothetical protein
MSKGSSSASSATSPPAPRRLRADQLLQGPKFAPEKLVTLYSPEEWELFVREWLEALKGKYHTVERLGGAGDQGRDVVAYTTGPSSGGAWDSFQCKHYQKPLIPTDVWVELGKLCYYTFLKEYTVPRSYSFVAPRDVGTSLFKLIEKPEQLRKELIENWDKHCRAGITETKDVPEVPLTGELRMYVESFDFNIITFQPIRKIIDQLRGTPYFIPRFGGSLPDRPAPDQPPPAIAAHETRYVRQLLNAYGECLSCEFQQADELPATSLHQRHFDRSREDFYRVESLRVFSRAYIAEDAFDGLQDEVCRGVIDVAESDHKDGFERVKATVRAARELQIQSHALVSVLTTDDRSGICHHLANSDKLTWVNGK